MEIIKITNVKAFEAKTMQDLEDFIVDFLVSKDADAVHTSLVHTGATYSALLTYSICRYGD